MNNKKIFAALIVLPIAVYAGLKLWIGHNVKESMEQLTNAARPFASLRYSTISSTLWNGRVSIEGVRIRPNGFSEDLVIRDLEFRTGGPLALVMAPRQLRASELPPQLQIAARGVTLDTNGPLFGAMETLQRASAPKEGLAHCGGLAYIGPQELRQLGYDTLSMDVALRYEHIRQPEQLQVSLDWSTRDMVALHTSFTLTGAPSTWKLAPNLSAVKVTYKDLSYTERLKKFCTKASAITEAAYIEAEVNRPDSAYRQQWGFVPGPGLRAAYRQFLEKPGELVLVARPGGIDPRTLEFYKPEDILTMLNVTASLDGAAIADLSFTRDAIPSPAKATATARAPAAVERAFSPEASNQDTSPARATTGNYRTVRMSELPKHLGRQVRISLPKGVVREGKLVEVLPNMVTVSRDYGRGDMKFDVLAKQVEKAEVQE